MNTEELLSTIQQMVSDVNEVNATNEKIERLRKYPQLKPFLRLLYDPLQTTGVTSDQLTKYAQKKKPPTSGKKAKPSVIQENDLVQLIEKLYRRDYSGNEAKDVVLDFINRNYAHKDLIYKIIDKDLETRMDVKQINKSFPNLIAEFSCALAKDFTDAQSYFEKNQDKTWFISRKYDGVRVIVKVENGKVCAYSRNGNRLPALAPLEELVASKVSEMTDKSFVLDGEICVVDDQGNEDFTKSVSQAKRKSVRMENFKYYMFDFLTLNEFETGESKSILSDRLGQLKSFVKHMNHPRLVNVEMVPYTDENLKTYQKLADDGKWEGLMVRLDTAYKGKRSNDILKMKKFYTEEYKVVDYEVGPMRIINNQTGLEETIQTLKSVIIEHKENKVNVGSGFSLDERRKYYENPDLIVGKIIGVRYFEESSDKDGKLSLRFPTFIANYGNKRDV
jgi:DNA ligase-1